MARIISLQMKNFRGFINQTLTFDGGRTYIAGVNGAGKTSTREAIKWLLTGRAIGLDNAGRGIGEMLARWDAPKGDKTIVKGTIVVDQGGNGRELVVEREWDGRTATLTVDGIAGGQGTQDALCDLVHADVGVILAALDASTFTRLKHTEGKDVLGRILNVRVSVDGDQLTLEQLDAKYDAVFKRRTDVNSALKRHVVPPAPEMAPPNIVELEAKLDGLVEQERKDNAALSEKIGGRQPLEDELSRLIARKSELQRSMSSAGEPDCSGRGAMLDRQTAIVKQVNELTGIAIDLNAPDFTLVVQALTSQISEASASFHGTIAACSAHDPSKGCVLDQRIPCQTAADEFVKIAKLLDKDGKRRKKEQPDLEQRLKQVTALASEHTQIAKDMARFDELAKHQASLQQQHDQISGDIEQVETKLGACEDVSAEQTALTALRDRIKVGRDKIAAAKQLKDQQARHDDGKRVYADLEKEQVDLNAQCERLGPNGLRVQAIERALSIFTDHMNGALKPLEWQVSFCLDPWRILVNGRPLETWSNAQQLVIGAAMQIAISDLTGFGLAVVDAIDALDAKRRVTLTPMVMQAQIDQVIVMATRDEDAAMPRVQGLQAVRL